MSKNTQKTTKERASEVVGEYLAALADIPAGFSDLSAEEQAFFESADRDWKTCRENLNRCAGHGQEQGNRDVVTGLQRGEIDFETAYHKLNVPDERTKQLELGLKLRLQSQAYDVVKTIFGIVIREQARFQAAANRVQSFKSRLEDVGLAIDGGVLASCREQIRNLDTFVRENACGEFVEYALKSRTLEDGTECEMLENAADFSREPPLLRSSNGLHQAPSSILKRLQV